MAKIGETVDESELEENPSKVSPKNEGDISFADKVRAAWEATKKTGKQLGNATVNGVEAAATGAMGPFTAVPAGILALEMKAAHGGDLSDRFKQAQQTYGNNLSENPLSGMLGAAVSPINKLIPGGAGVLGKAANSALQGASMNSGLGGSALGGAAAGGGISLLGSGIGAAVKGAANSEMLSPTLNRLKFLKPSPEEAQPLSGAGQDIREAIKDTSAQGLWSGAPSREVMLNRFQEAQGPAGKRIGDILQQADTVNAGRVTPDVSMPNGQSTLKSLLAHSSSSGDNPARLQGIAEQEGANISDASGSLQSLNKAKQGIYAQTYTPNKPEMGDRFLPGRDQLLRSMGRDVKTSVQGALDNLHEIDPSVDAQGFASANKQYGSLADLIGPLNRAVGKDLGGEHVGGGIRASTHGSFYGNVADLLNLGGRRQLMQAHAGEAAQSASNALSTYKPAQAVAKAFIAGTTPGMKQEGDDLENQP